MVNKTEFLCPLCEGFIITENSQVYCENENCKFNPTIDDLLAKLYKRSNK